MARPKCDAHGYFNVTITLGYDGSGKRLRKRIRSKTLAGLRGHRLEALFWAALLLGMRQGELLALRWADVDVEQGVIWVRGGVQRQRLHREAEKGKRSIRAFVPTKTPKGVRPLALVRPLDAVLAAHRARQGAERN
jgi:integrase